MKAILHATDHGGLLPGLSAEVGNTLTTTAHQLIDRRGVTRSTVEPAVLSLILVALVLLSRLLSAAMTLRRGELALASLRGYNRRQLWFLGMLEPLLILAAAIPLGVVAGYVGSRVLAHRWLVPHLPVPFILASALAVVAVVLVTAVVAAVVVRDAVSEPLSAQIAGVRRPTKAGRLVVVLRLALVALAAAALVTAASRTSPRKPDATDLALPILLAVAAGLLVGLLVLGLAGLWVRWSARRRALSSYVAARTVRRRREGTMVILPVTAALTVAVFAVGVSLAASTWRASTAATEVGAPLSYSTPLSLSRAVGLTRQLDPQGRWLMAAGQDIPNADEITSIPQPRVVVDATRLARVASWPAQWTPGRSAADIARAIGPRRAPVVMKGSPLSVTVDNAVHGDYARLGCDGERARRPGGGAAASRSDRSRRARRRRRPSCAPVRADARSRASASGAPTRWSRRSTAPPPSRRSPSTGRPSPAVLDKGWQPQASQIGTKTAVTKVSLGNGQLTVAFSRQQPGVVRRHHPDRRPRRRTGAVRAAGHRDVEPAHGVPRDCSRCSAVGAPAESVPFRGPSGVLMDFTAFVRSASQTNSLSQVFVWARADTPKSVLDGLAARGLSNPTTEVADPARPRPGRLRPGAAALRRGHRRW